MLGEQCHLHTGFQRLDLRCEIRGDDGRLRRRARLGESGEGEQEEKASHVHFIKRIEASRSDNS
jgi:hypothetical protein